ncbi:hypothetical protein [Planktotalea sp.]|uniref:hypothetical protein n=1 Tax=Planktotalea sp. TaxID=2029877 RepID=UPI0025EA30C8|nr:hypothetical protein [Planktotalea sp.]
MFEFNEFLHKMGLAPAEIRLLRHDPRGVTAWQQGRETRFGCFASFQKRENSPYLGANFACHFLPGPNLPDGSASAETHALGIGQLPLANDGMLRVWLPNKFTLPV